MSTGEDITGDVHAIVSDPEQAEAAFRTALVVAQSNDDAYGITSAWQRLSELLAGRTGREFDAAEADRQSRKALSAEYGGPRVALKIGRNDPCPCGSGRKHKRCCAP